MKKKENRKSIGLIGKIFNDERIMSYFKSIGEIEKDLFITNALINKQDITKWNHRVTK
ncbi:hypothetical protein [Enterococcus avium]|uniref:hypothetical protein n=1 Tax=Enterococcus avium TaxID=33945 RepID=UPI0022E62E28|nr:hypothetical protein [Enterococcus avium]